MNDDFLKNFVRRPRTKFAEDLYRQLERRERKNTIMRLFAQSVATLLIVLAVIFTTSPVVRAATLEIFRDIGGFKVILSDTPPTIETREVSPPVFRDVTLNEAYEQFEGQIQLPEYIPAGFELLPVVRLTSISELQDHQFARFKWQQVIKDEEENEIHIFITLELDYAPAQVEKPAQYISESGLEEVAINGKQAILIQGVWDHEQKEYIEAPFTSLIWMLDDETVYTISANNKLVENQELIKMAQSIQ